jgi:hypothetical protein
MGSKPSEDKRSTATAQTLLRLRAACGLYRALKSRHATAAYGDAPYKNEISFNQFSLIVFPWTHQTNVRVKTAVDNLKMHPASTDATATALCSCPNTGSSIRGSNTAEINCISSDMHPVWACNPSRQSRRKIMWQLLCHRTTHKPTA